MGEKLPQPAAPATVAANNAPKVLEIKPGPPPVLTKRGADILVQVEKLLDDAAKTAERTTATEPAEPARPDLIERARLPRQFRGGEPRTKRRRRARTTDR